MNASPIGKQRCPCGMSCEFLPTIGSSYIGQGKCMSSLCDYRFYMGVKIPEPPRPGYGPILESETPIPQMAKRLRDAKQRTKGVK